MLNSTIKKAVPLYFPDSTVIDFQFMFFDSHDAIIQYMKDPQYNLDDAHPGICFGWSLTENSKSDYDLNMIFDDHY